MTTSKTVVNRKQITRSHLNGVTETITLDAHPSSKDWLSIEHFHTNGRVKKGSIWCGLNKQKLMNPNKQEEMIIKKTTVYYPKFGWVNTPSDQQTPFVTEQKFDRYNWLRMSQFFSKSGCYAFPQYSDGIFGVVKKNPKTSEVEIQNSKGELIHGMVHIKTEFASFMGANEVYYGYFLCFGDEQGTLKKIISSKSKRSKEFSRKHEVQFKITGMFTLDSQSSLKFSEIPMTFKERWEKICSINCEKLGLKAVAPAPAKYIAVPDINSQYWINFDFLGGYATSEIANTIDEFHKEHIEPDLCFVSATQMLYNSPKTLMKLREMRRYLSSFVIVDVKKEPDGAVYFLVDSTGGISNNTVLGLPEKYQTYVIPKKPRDIRILMGLVDKNEFINKIITCKHMGYVYISGVADQITNKLVHVNLYKHVCGYQIIL